VAVQAQDAVGLLDHVGADRAHVVGHSLGGAIALELAARNPARVASLVLLEPVLLMTTAGAAFGRALAPLTERYEAGDAEGGVHGFLALVGDRNWRAVIDQAVPGGIAQVVKDAATFFETEVPGVPSWTFGPEQAAAITCPVLSVLGSRSSPLFAEGRQLLHAWFPACQDVDIVGGIARWRRPQPTCASQPDPQTRYRHSGTGTARLQPFKLLLLDRALNCGFCAPRGIRTPNRQIRRLVLYVHAAALSAVCAARVRGRVQPVPDNPSGDGWWTATRTATTAGSESTDSQSAGLL
jgi:hypothetical protein